MVVAYRQEGWVVFYGGFKVEVGGEDDSVYGDGRGGRDGSRVRDTKGESTENSQGIFHRLSSWSAWLYIGVLTNNRHVTSDQSGPVMCKALSYLEDNHHSD